MERGINGIKQFMKALFETLVKRRRGKERLNKSEWERDKREIQSYAFGG